jgi:hypothetical protein
VAANFDYSMSELGKCSIECLENGPEVSYFLPASLGVTGIAALGGLGVAIPASVCMQGGSCAMAAIFGPLFGVGAGGGLILFSILLAKDIYENKDKPKKQRQRLAEIIRQAYRAQTKNRVDQMDALTQMLRYLAEVA